MSLTLSKKSQDTLSNKLFEKLGLAKLGRSAATIYLVGLVSFLSVYRTTQIGLKKLLLTVIGRELDTNWVHGIAARWAQGIFRYMPGWRVSVEGQENLPKGDQSFVIVSNHGSATDILVVYYLGLQFRWLSKKEVFSVPVIGQAMRWAGYVSVTRGERSSHKKAMEESAAWLRRGTPMFFFPEGSRSVDGNVRPFKVGAFKLAIDSKVAVLPIVIEGAHKLIKKGSMTPGKAHVTVKILPQVAPQETEDVQDFADRTREIIISNMQDSRIGTEAVGRDDKSLDS